MGGGGGGSWGGGNRGGGGGGGGGVVFKKQNVTANSNKFVLVSIANPLGFQYLTLSVKTFHRD